jgi:predicted anti-sigma-YlaC factor YlaD
MDCSKSLQLLSDLRDGALEEAEVVSVRSHLSKCPPCNGVFLDLDTIVATASVLRNAESIAFPDENALWHRMALSKRTIH